MRNDKDLFFLVFFAYIDSYGAVGATSSGWYDGMLSDDGIHPTELGAKVLASQILVDVPELMSYGRKEN